MGIVEFARGLGTYQFTQFITEVNRRDNDEFSPIEFNKPDITKYSNMRLQDGKIKVTIEDEDRIMRVDLEFDPTGDFLAQCVNLFHQKTIAAKTKHEALNQVVK